MAILGLRSPKSLLLIGLTLFFFFSVLHTPTRTVATDELDFRFGPTLDQLKSPKGPPSQLVHDAHRLPVADAFHAHFDAVTKLPPLDPFEARSSCDWSKEESQHINFQYPVDQDWVKKPWSATKIARLQHKWKKFVKNDMIPFNSSIHGKGVVMAGGNDNSLERAAITLRQMKRLGSNISVEIHHYNEVKPDKRKEMEDEFPNLRILNLADRSNRVQVQYSVSHVNYHLKIAAILNSRFAEVLLLDTDNIPIIPPEELFMSKTYLQYGTVFWPDIARTRPENPIWPITNTHCAKDEYEQESGQMLVDKRKFWYHLQLSMYFVRDAQAATYLLFLLGDKDAFRFAWKALRTAYGQPAHWVTLVGFRGTDTSFCSIAFGQYHPDLEDGRIAFLHANSLKSHEPYALDWIQKNRGGIFKWAKKHPHDTDYSFNFRASMHWDGYDYMTDISHPLTGVFPPTCLDIEDAEPVELEKILPGGFQKIWDEIKGDPLALAPLTS